MGLSGRKKELGESHTGECGIEVEMGRKIDE